MRETRTSGEGKVKVAVLLIFIALATHGDNVLLSHVEGNALAHVLSG